MTNTNKFIIILIIAILIFLFQNKPDKEQLDKKAPDSNIVITEKKVKPKKKHKLPVIVKDESIRLDLDKNTKESENTNHLTYLNIYKKYRLAIDCRGIFMAEDSKHDQIFYIDEFVREIKHRSNKRQAEVTEAQLLTYEDFVDSCWDLYLDMPDISDLTIQQIKQDPYTTRETLKKLLQVTDALTPEEVELKEVLIAGFRFSKVDKSLWELSRGTHTLSEQELKATYKEIDEKKAEIRKLVFDNPHTYDVNELDRLTIELQEIEDYLADSIVIDNPELQFKKSQFDRLAMEIFAHAQTPYVTVFFEVFTSLNFTNQINGILKPNYSLYKEQKYKENFHTFSQKLYSDLVVDSVLSNEEYFNHVINPAIHLYLCYLGEDCSADSIVVQNYCATNRQKYGERRQYIYSEACGKSVNEFYTQSYLSANLAKDVDWLLKYLVSQYAH